MLKMSSGFRLGGVCAGWATEEFSSCLCCALVSSTAVLFFFFLLEAASDEGNGLVWLVDVKQSEGNDKVKGDQIQTVTLKQRVASKGKHEERDVRVVRNEGEPGGGAPRAKAVLVIWFCTSEDSWRDRCLTSPLNFSPNPAKPDFVQTSLKPGVESNRGDCNTKRNIMCDVQGHIKNMTRPEQCGGH